MTLDFVDELTSNEVIGINLNRFSLIDDLDNGRHLGVNKIAPSYQAHFLFRAKSKNLNKPLRDELISNGKWSNHSISSLGGESNNVVQRSPSCLGL